MAPAEGATTSLWWDVQSCPLPSYVDPYIVASMASALIRNFNINTSMGNARGDCSSLYHYHFSAYGFFSETQPELLQTLINSGIELHQFPPGKSNNEMEKMMMEDVLLWAMDTLPPANIIFIIGRVDFCYLFQKLRQRSYNVFLICQSMSEMPQGMLCGVNYCLGWLSFLGSLHNEHQQSQFTEPNEQKSPMASPGWWNPSPNQKTRSKGEPRADPEPKASADDVRKFRYYMPGPQGFLMAPLDERIGLHTGKFPNFPNFSQSKKPRSPVSSASTTEETKLASLEEFKAWLTVVVDGKKHAEEGYNISPIRVDFQKATGKILDEKFLGFSKIRTLLKNCNDIVVIKKVKRRQYLAFPVKPNEQKNPMPSPGGWNSKFEQSR